MSTNPGVEKAARAMWEADMKMTDAIPSGVSGVPIYWLARAEAFMAAGLLVTPLHERAIKACEAHYKMHGNGRAAIDLHGDLARPCDVCGSVGEEVAAAKRSKERWQVLHGSMGSGVQSADGKIMVNAFSSGFPMALSSEQARVVAAALNALESK